MNTSKTTLRKRPVSYLVILKQEYNSLIDKLNESPTIQKVDDDYGLFYTDCWILHGRGSMLDRYYNDSKYKTIATKLMNIIKEHSKETSLPEFEEGIIVGYKKLPYIDYKTIAYIKERLESL